MLHLFYGSDDYSSTAEAAAVVAGLQGESEAPVARYEGGASSWTSIREACQSLSLFSPTQVVVVRGLLGHWSGRGDGGGKAEGGASRGEGSGKIATKPSPAEFAVFVTALPARTELVLLEGDLSLTNRYLKELSALPKDVAVQKSLSLPQGAARQQWTVRVVRARNGVIEPDVAALLAERSKEDLWALSSEIDKLLAYTAPQHNIRREDVLLLTPTNDETTGFDLLEALADKKERQVVDLLERLLDNGQAPEALLALVGARLRDLGLLVAAQVEGLSRDEILSRTGWNPGRYGHVQRARGQFSARELLDAQGVLLAADHVLKSRPSHERPVVTLLSCLAIARRRGAAELVAALAY